MMKKYFHPPLNFALAGDVLTISIILNNTFRFPDPLRHTFGVPGAWTRIRFIRYWGISGIGELLTHGSVALHQTLLPNCLKNFQRCVATFYRTFTKRISIRRR